MHHKNYNFFIYISSYEYIFPGEWKIQNIHIILEELCQKCPELRGLNLSGWSGLTAENLKYLTTECSKLERLDLSAVNVSLYK